MNWDGAGWHDQVQTPPAWTVVGLDLSLTATGIATLRGHTAPKVQTLRSKGAKDASLDERTMRLHNLARDIIIAACIADVVVIEQPAYNQTGGSHHDRSGLWWLVVDGLAFEELKVVEVTPQAVKKYATGKGNASKDQVAIATTKRYPNVDVTNNNEADAFVLAAIGARLAGHPIEASLPQAHLDALTKVRWPR